MEKIQQVKTREKNILLQNIQQLEDAPEDEEDSLHNLPLSPDGKYLVLTAADESEDAMESGDFSQPMEKLTVESMQQPISDSFDTEDIEPESEAWCWGYAMLFGVNVRLYSHGCLTDVDLLFCWSSERTFLLGGF